jgi:hypothetical protein
MPCRAACAVLVDPWYPAIPRDAPARTRWRSGAACLVLGSAAFNRASEHGPAVCEGEEEGLQDAVLRACAAGGSAADTTAARASASASTTHSNPPAAHAGSIFLVPSQSQHTMVDDMGAVLMDKYAPMRRVSMHPCHATHCVRRRRPGALQRLHAPSPCMLLPPSPGTLQRPCYAGRCCLSLAMHATGTHSCPAAGHASWAHLQACCRSRSAECVLYSQACGAGRKFGC